MYRRASVTIDGDRPFDCYGAPEQAIHVGDCCILEVNGVPEFGRVVELGETTEELPPGRAIPKLLHQATLQDQSKANENALRSRMARDTCAAKAEKLGLHVHLVRVRYSFNRGVLHILFTAEENIDTKTLIRELSSELGARIDIKQIGVRDEAGMIGGVGVCGRSLCCCSWLQKFEPVNMRMAKTQGVSMNPSVMSGLCGRLKCCMRYEFDVYKDLTRGLPRSGAIVNCPDGKGMVLESNVLGQRVKVRLEDERILEYELCDVSECWAKKGGSRREDDEDPGDQRAESDIVGPA
jgi:cell fate regulator YaaT (PSP1 superfamily)